MLLGSAGGERARPEAGRRSTLHTYDTGADGAARRLTVFWQHGTPARPSHFSPPPSDLAFAGCRTTGPDTAGQPLRQAETASGSRAAATRQNYGCFRTTDTSRFSTPPRRPWTGSERTPNRTA